MEKALRLKLPNGRFDDVPALHSARMRAIKEKGNRSTELRARAILIRRGIRGWVLHPAGLPGKPDFYFPNSRVVLFVDGCYWHGCVRCRHDHSTNQAYWSAKIERNAMRDRSNNRQLRKVGLSVMRVWEHELKLGCQGRWVQSLQVLLAEKSSLGEEHDNK